MTITPQSRDQMIRTIIGEAGSQGPDGWRAVAHVIKNRVDSGAWGPREGGIGRVIYAPKQFSTWNPGNASGDLARHADPNSPAYQRIGQIVDRVFDTGDDDNTGGGTHFYNKKLANPDWAAQGANVRQIGDHTFMTLPFNPATTAGTVLSSYKPPETTTPGAVRFSVAPNVVTQGLDPTLLSTVQEATKYLPPGWSAQLTSGFRAGDPRFHGKGKALDIQLIDPSGKPLANYQNEANFRTYEEFAQRVHQLQKPGDTPIRWGGYFAGKTGPGGVYGATDLMHFDVGDVPMGGGDWSNGLTPAQRALIPNAMSHGLGGADVPPPPSAYGYSSSTPAATPSAPTPMEAPYAPSPLPGAGAAPPVLGTPDPKAKFQLNTGTVTQGGPRPQMFTSLNLGGGSAPPAAAAPAPATPAPAAAPPAPATAPSGSGGGYGDPKLWGDPPSSPSGGGGYGDPRLWGDPGSTPIVNTSAQPDWLEALFHGPSPGGTIPGGQVLGYQAATPQGPNMGYPATSGQWPPPWLSKLFG